jgi:hypothetical protein
MNPFMNKSGIPFNFRFNILKSNAPNAGVLLSDRNDYATLVLEKNLEYASGSRLCRILLVPLPLELGEFQFKLLNCRGLSRLSNYATACCENTLVA